MSDEAIDALTQRGMEALRNCDQRAANAAFAARDQLANQMFGNAPVPEIAADGAVVPPVESHGEPTIDADALAEAEMHAVLSQSVSGKGLTARDIANAKENALEFEKRDPAAAALWVEYAESSADALGEVMSRLSRGEVPSGPPNADELTTISRRHAAQRELDLILAQAPPGSEAYRSNSVQRRVSALHQLISGHQPIVGRGRFVY
jgi:hypothetical protein